MSNRNNKEKYVLLHGGIFKTFDSKKELSDVISEKRFENVKFITELNGISLKSLIHSAIIFDGSTVVPKVKEVDKQITVTIKERTV